ncbi:hypothetical protein [Celeribacter arenosi]|uniref:Uncharacterized protein n=1 Tax=Celeribacter arenosi TaxID=792649 RepID=A0ABP7JTZ0_9RHOB
MQNDFPVVEVDIQKLDGKPQGMKRVTFPNFPDCKIAFEYIVHAPFTQNNLYSNPAPEPGDPNSGRQIALATIVSLICSQNNGRAPYRFQTLSGEKWRLEMTATYWLSQSSDFELEKDGSNFFLKSLKLTSG